MSAQLFALPIATLESLPGFCWAADDTGRCVACSAAFESESGLPRAEILGMAANELADLVETMFPTPDGITVTAIADDAGARLGTLCARHHTPDTETWAESRENAENLRALINTIDDIIVVGSPEGYLLYGNNAALEKLHLTAEELPTKHILDLHPSDKREEAEQILGAMFRGERDTCPLPLQSTTGELVPVETRIWFGRWNGEDCIFGLSKDITREQEALQRFDRVFRSNPAPMAVSETLSRAFVDVNDAFLDKLGYERHDVIGKTSVDLGLFANPEEQARVAQELAATGRIESVGIQVRRKDGTLLDGEFSGEVIESQGRAYLLTVMLDVTERKRAEAALAYAVEAAQAANEAKSGFLSTMSHELRTPLNSIIGFTGLLAEGLSGPLNAEQRRQIDMINASGKRLLELVNQVLDLAKIESGSLEPATAGPTDLRAVAREALETIRPMTAVKNVELLWFESGDIHPVTTDGGRVSQILLNLLSNAAKYTDEGHIAVRITSDPEESSISVEDTGRGIRPDELEHIFDEFYQAKDESGIRGVGTGLGLAVSKRLADSIGAGIEASSTRGVGSVFTLHLPNEWNPTQTREPASNRDGSPSST